MTNDIRGTEVILCDGKTAELFVGGHENSALIICTSGCWWLRLSINVGWTLALDGEATPTRTGQILRFKGRTRPKSLSSGCGPGRPRSLGRPARADELEALSRAFAGTVAAFNP